MSPIWTVCRIIHQQGLVRHQVQKATKAVFYLINTKKVDQTKQENCYMI